MDFQKNYDLYKIFFKLCEVKSYSKTAELLHYNSHTTISNAVVALAKQVGVEKLFTAHSRGVEPTSEALDLYAKTKPLFNQIDFYENNLKEFNDTSSGRINIVYTTNFASSYLADHIIRFNKKYPNVEFNLLKEPSISKAVKLIENREVDLIISGLSMNESDDITVVTLETLSSSFFASTDFAKKYKISSLLTKEQFNELPFIAFKEYGEFKKAIVTLDTWEAMFQLVDKGLGTGWSLDKYFDIVHPQTPIIKFSVDGITLPEYTLNFIFSKRFLNKAASAFIKNCI